MSSLTPCEELVTRAEFEELKNKFEELKNKINNTFGKSEDGGIVDILEAESLGGTQINARLIKDWRIVEDEETNATVVKMELGMDDNPITKIKEGATAGVELIKVSVGSIAQLAAVGWLLFKNEKLRRDTGNEIIKDLVDFIDNNETAKGIEETLREAGRHGNSLIDLFDRVNGNVPEAKETVIHYKEKIIEQRTEIIRIKEVVNEQGVRITNTENRQLDQIEFDKYLNREIEKVRQQVKDNTFVDNQTKTYLDTQIKETKKQLKDEKERSDKMIEITQKLGERLAKTEGDLTETADRYNRLKEGQDDLYTRITQVERDLTEDRPLTTIKLVEQIYRGGGGGGGVPPGVQNSITTQQKKTVELLDKITNSNSNYNPNYFDIVNNEDDFEETVNRRLAQVPNFSDYPDFTETTNTNFETVFEQIRDLSTTRDNEVTPDDLREFQNNITNDVSSRMDTLITDRLVPPIIDIRNRTSPSSIASATTTALCDSTSPTGCLTTNVTNPLKRFLGNNLTNGLAGLNTGLSAFIASQNSAILTITRNTNAVVNHGTFGLKTIQEGLQNAFNSSIVDKTLNGINTALLVHNAVHLSGQIVETIGDTASIVLNVLGIKDTDNQVIDVNSVIKSKLRNILIGFVGSANYTALTNRMARANRIYQAGQNILDDVTDLFDSSHQIAEETGGNVAKIGNALREAGEVDFDAYEEMREDVRATSKVFKRLEQLEGATDKVYSITSEVESIQETINSIRENRREFTEELDKFTDDEKRKEEQNELSIEKLI